MRTDLPTYRLYNFKRLLRAKAYIKAWFLYLSGKDFLPANIYTGLSRLWMACSVLWVLYWLFIGLSAAIALPGERQELQQWCQEASNSLAKYGYPDQFSQNLCDASSSRISNMEDAISNSLNFILFLPAVSFGAYAILIWIIKGFYGHKEKPPFEFPFSSFKKLGLEKIGALLVFSGRIRRRNYIIGLIVLGVLSSVFVKVPLLQVLFAYFNSVIIVMRMHDMGRSWKRAVPLLITLLVLLFYTPVTLTVVATELVEDIQPIALRYIAGGLISVVALAFSLRVFLLGFECLCREGTKGRNAYGEDPIPATVPRRSLTF